MSNLQLYSKATVRIESSTFNGILAEETSVKVDRNTNSQAVSTVQKGYAGESVGAAMTTITVEGAVPTVSVYMDPGGVMGLSSVDESTLEPIKIYIDLDDGRTLTCEGFIHTDNFSHAINAASKLDFSFRGGPAVWE